MRLQRVGWGERFGEPQHLWYVGIVGDLLGAVLPHCQPTGWMNVENILRHCEQFYREAIHRCHSIGVVWIASLMKPRSQ